MWLGGLCESGNIFAFEQQDVAGIGREPEGPGEPIPGRHATTTLRAKNKSACIRDVTTPAYVRSIFCFFKIEQQGVAGIGQEPEGTWRANPRESRNHHIEGERKSALHPRRHNPLLFS